MRRLLSRAQFSESLQVAGHGFKEAVKYYLPKLLMQPIYQFYVSLHYIEVCVTQYRHLGYKFNIYLNQVLQERSSNEEDRDTLKQVLSQLIEFKSKLDEYKNQQERWWGMTSYARKKVAVEKIKEMLKIERWDPSNNAQYCNEFFRGHCTVHKKFQDYF